MNGFVVGLTGGIAAGKSTVQEMLAGRGVPVADTDDIAHELMKPGGEAYQGVVDYFGESVLHLDGRIDRRKLGAVVFRSADERQVLNGLVHPVVHRTWRQWADYKRKEGTIAVVAIPLLYEVGADRYVDGVLCVVAPENAMVQRLLERGFTEEEAQQRIASQLPVQEKASRATWVINNDSSLDTLTQRVDEVWAQIDRDLHARRATARENGEQKHV